MNILSEFRVLISISKLYNPIFGPLIYKAGVQIIGPWISNPAPIFGPYIFYPLQIEDKWKILGIKVYIIFLMRYKNIRKEIL